jgi:hypothetical protein
MQYKHITKIDCAELLPRRAPIGTSEKVGSVAAKVVADSARAKAEVAGQKDCQLHAQES